MPLAFSTTEAAKGARALSDILTAVPKAKAETSILQTEAKMRGMELENILAAKQAAAEPPSPVGEPQISVQEQLFGNTSAAIVLQKDIMTHRQQLEQAKKVLQAMPNPGTAAYRDQETKISRMTKDLHAYENKLIQHQEKVGAANFLFLEGIQNQQGLDGANATEQQQLGKIFDEQSGVSRDDPAYAAKRAAFIKNNNTLPKTYDDAGKAKLELLKSKSASAKDELDLLKIRRQAEADQLRFRASLAHDDAMERREARRQASKDRQDKEQTIGTERRLNRDALDKNAEQMKMVEKEIAQEQNPLTTTEPSKTSFLGGETPEHIEWRNMMDEKKNLLSKMRATHEKLMREGQRLKEKLHTVRFGEPLAETPKYTSKVPGYSAEQLISAARAKFPDRTEEEIVTALKKKGRLE